MPNDDTHAHTQGTHTPGTPVTFAAPVDGSIDITATCDYCGRRIRKVYLSANSPWWHGETGAERCPTAHTAKEDNDG